MKIIDYIDTDTAGTVPVYDFKFATPEREKELAEKYPLTDPERRKEAEALRRQPLNIPETMEAEK